MCRRGAGSLKKGVLPKSFKNLDLSAVGHNSQIRVSSHRQYYRATQELHIDIWVYGAIIELKNKVCELSQEYGTVLHNIDKPSPKTTYS